MRACCTHPPHSRTSTACSTSSSRWPLPIKSPRTPQRSSLLDVCHNHKASNVHSNGPTHPHYVRGCGVDVLILVLSDPPSARSGENVRSAAIEKPRSRPAKNSSTSDMRLATAVVSETHVSVRITQVLTNAPVSRKGVPRAARLMADADPDFFSLASSRSSSSAKRCMALSPAKKTSYGTIST